MSKETLSVSMDAELMKRLKEFAEQDQRTVSSFVSHVVTKEIKRRQKELDNE